MTGGIAACLARSDSRGAHRSRPPPVHQIPPDLLQSHVLFREQLFRLRHCVSDQLRQDDSAAEILEIKTRDVRTIVAAIESRPRLPVLSKPTSQTRLFFKNTSCLSTFTQVHVHSIFQHLPTKPYDTIMDKTNTNTTAHTLPPAGVDVMLDPMLWPPPAAGLFGLEMSIRCARENTLCALLQDIRSRLSPYCKRRIEVVYIHKVE